MLDCYLEFIHHIVPFRQKSEENLAVAESELERQTRTVADLTHQVDELQNYAAEAARLKDQVDE